MINLIVSDTAKIMSLIISFFFKEAKVLLKESLKSILKNQACKLAATGTPHWGSQSDSVVKIFGNWTN